MRKHIHHFLVQFLFLLGCVHVVRCHSTVGDVLLEFFSHLAMEPYADPPAEAFMSTAQLITKEGYPVEEHQVITPDGYILTLFRIPYGKSGPKFNRPKREPIILQHGFLCSSNDWLLIHPPSDNLPYILADENYDVWLGNARGNNYSFAHISLTKNDTEYWDFSFTEMGLYDIPTIIEYILEKTDYPQLSYVGHSMGVAMISIALDRYPELNQKIRTMVALAPAVYINHCKTPMRFLATAPSPIFMGFQYLVAGGRLIPRVIDQYLKKYGPFLCSGDTPTELCDRIMFFVVGWDREQLSNETTLMIAGHTPSDTSARTLSHYLQYTRSGQFADYDFGYVDNIRKYGFPHPPKFNLSKVTVPTKVLYGCNDWLVVPEDALRTISELGNVVESSEVDLTRCQHMDFLYARDARRLIYDPCVKYLKFDSYNFGPSSF